MENIAKVRKRVLAALIDYTVYTGLFAFYLIAFGEPNGEGGYTAEGMRAFPILFIWLLYFPVVEGFFGQTLGKKILGIRVTSSQGRDIGMGTSFLRHLFDFIDLSFVGLVGIIVMKSSQNNQRVGDHVAGTLVVEDRYTRCQFCNEELSLNAHEARTGVFICPKCKKQNTPLDLIDSEEA
ncbi:MAG TPA: RDD family protein [Chryseosolibacter sp.]